MPAIGELARKAFSIAHTAGPDFSGVNGHISHTDGFTTLSGIRVDETGALRIAACWIATTLLADEVSSIPLKLVRKGDLTRIPEEPPALRPLWDQPNPDMTVQTWMATNTLSLLLSGVCYGALGWQRDGSLGVAWDIDPSNAKLSRHEDGVSLQLDCPGQGTLTNIANARPEFLMIPLYRLPGQLQPISPVRYAAELLGLSRAYERTAASLMARGLNPSAILTSSEAVDQKVGESVAARLEANHSGSKGGGLAFLAGKDLKLEKWGMTLADAEFVAQNAQVFALVMALWRVPPTVAGMVDKPSTWGTGVEAFAQGLHRFTTRPLLVRFQGGLESSVTKWVDPALQVRFRVDALLSASPKEKMEIQRLGLAGGVTSVERILAQNDEAPFSADETVYSPLNIAEEEDRALARLKTQADAAASLFRAGWSVESAAAAVGLTGAVPAPTKPPASPPPAPPAGQ